MKGCRKETTLEIRELIINHFKEGKSVRKIAEICKRGRSTVHDIIQKYKHEGRLKNKKRSGRPPILTEQDKRTIIRKIKQNPKLSAPKIATELEIGTGIKVNPETVRNVLRKANYHGRTARRKSYINERNRKRRLVFAKTCIHYDKKYWEHVIFADESKFNVFGSDGRAMVWRKPNEEMKIKNLVPTMKHGGGSLMVWGCMSAAGVGDLVIIEGIMNQHVYLDILKTHLRSSAEKMGILDTFRFYQDNDPKHKSHLVRQWLLYNCPKVLDTPAQSPDINPIEHLWDVLDRKIRKCHISSKSDLKTVLLQEWAKISQEVTFKLATSIPSRLRSVIKAKGGPTKY